MNIESQSESVWPLIGTMQPGDLWRTAVRLTASDPVEDVLGHLFDQSSVLSAKFGCDVRISVEPDGDACDTGHFTNLLVVEDLLRCEMTPWPSRHGGQIPWEIELELVASGWHLESNEILEVADDLLSTRAAVHRFPVVGGVVSPSTSQQLASAVCRGVRSVLGPVDDRWYVTADVWLWESCALAHGLSPVDRIWTIDVGTLLPANSWERAIWPSDSEAGALACRAGMHQYHEPPCRAWPLP